MKFIALNSALTTGPGCIAAHVDPAVDSEAFNCMQTLAARQNVPVWVNKTPNGLVCVEHTDRQEGVVTGDILRQLEELYQKAAELVAAETKARDAKRSDLVQRASECSGLPVDTVAA